MNKKIILAVAVSGIFFLIGNLSAEEAAKPNPQEKKAVAQTECPVMGGKIDKSLFVDAKGKRIYVCCGGCIGKIKADPEKYIKAMEAKGITIEETPKDKPATEKKEDTPKTEKK
ncbi:MAG TPA: hypothetical protein DCZ94_08450 [Lentisphaeria bacterium]|nr:MAG: hypothetical protein A2X48_09235 [Lentisphaerae bacterium GWF2_49_21]HBC86968.1 hypothetical protein [Lentisphaeria bacterium]